MKPSEATLTIMQSRVERGAQLLDRRAPQWWREVNLLTLDMGSCEFCVGGQVSELLDLDRGEYHYAMLSLDLSDDIQGEYGFDSCDDERYEQGDLMPTDVVYAILGELWVEQITNRALAASVR